MMIRTATVAVLLHLAALPAAAAPRPVSLESLLNEMIDRDNLARWPSPEYAAKEFTSYDRRSVSRDKPGWFANEDFGNYLRIEKLKARFEYVMMDADGPGAIVCMFKATTDPEATVRVYLDGASTPVIEENFRYLLGGGTETEQERKFHEKRVPPFPADESQFLGGFGTIKPPLAGVQSLGSNLYLPIPYARHCKVTYDKPGKCFYRINYRTYAASTPVETFTLPALKAASRLIDHVSETLLKGDAASEPAPHRLPPQKQTLKPGASIEATLTGPAAIRSLSLRIDSKNMPQALRWMVLGITFDDVQTVWCPAGDFFGSGIGIHPYHDWDCSVSNNGALHCSWVMPFQRSCTIELMNLGANPVEATLGEIGVGPWTWDDRSMYFHANWRQQYPIQTKGGAGTMDWNYIDAAARGVYVGDTLVVHNSCRDWWGEGDEKIYVDDETFPSHFGTGTEDYYGYSRGGTASQYFAAPFIAHPQIEGDFQPGYSAITRIRSLDAIPFRSRLKFDMEVWHWKATPMAYAAATCWYAMPMAASNRGPEKAEASRPILQDPAATGSDKR